MRSRAHAVAPHLTGLLAALVAATAHAQQTRAISFDDAVRAARRAAPELMVAQARERAARAEVGIAGVYPNPTLIGGTSNQTAKLSATLSVPLVILGQRAAAIDAARADEATVAYDTRVTWNDIRQQTARAFIGLWLAEGVAQARGDSAAIEATLESSVIQRVQVGSSPEIDALRVHAEKLRTDADLQDAVAQVNAAGSALGRWMGLSDGNGLRATQPPVVPAAPPPLNELLARLGQSAPLQRELSDVRASEARVFRERALVRPLMTLDVGLDAFDPSLTYPNQPNYRAQLAVEVPIFNQRGPFIDRERAGGEIARARVQSERVQLAAELTAAYQLFEAASARQRTLVDTVVPAARQAAKAMEDAYALGRVPLVAVLDAERSLIETRLTALDSQASGASAWADVEHALGAP